MTATASDVKDITGSTLDDAVIEPFISAANCILLRIDEVIVDMATGCRDHLEAYLAAHLLTISNVGGSSALVAKESLRGKYSVEYLMPKGTGTGVLGTPHGQTANAMSGGYLAGLDNTPISFNSIGLL